MEGETPEAEAPVETVRARPPLWQRIIKWAAIAVVTVAVLIAAAVIALNTDPGRRFVAQKISDLTLASGLNIRVGRIDGSLYGAMVLHDVQARDPKGVFATSREIALDWRPFSYLRNRIDIRNLASPEVRLMRLPELKSSGDPNAPILPDINLDIARLAVARIDIDPAVDGQRHIARLSGSAHLSDGRARIVADAATIVAPGVAGGDRLALRLDAVPDRDRLDIDLKLDAPAKGLVAGLARIDAPLTLNVDGKGNWKNWRGRAQGTLGGKELANLTILAQDGRFQVRGPTHPGLYMKEPVERLAAPQLDVALDAKWSDRKADGTLKLRSKALSVEGTGLVDLGNNRFGNLRVEAMLLTPGAIAPNLSGRSVRAALVLNGPFATPVVDYKVQAAAIGFGETVAEQLYAEGRARVDADHILVPVKARAARVSGLNAAVGGLVTNLTLNGDLAISGSRILSDNLKLKSDRVDATAIIAADVAKGRYTGALKGRVNDYVINGVGVVDLRTDAQLYAAPGGGWGIKGTIAGESRRIFSDGARKFLGGNAVASARVALDPRGIVAVSDLRMKAPEFRIIRGSGRYDPAGPILIDADAESNQYGPLTARVTGTLNAPQVLLRAPRPGLGVGLVDLEARVRGQGNAYAVEATGGTNYGPFSANVLVRTGEALALDIQAARFAGMDIAGQLQQTAAGPFAGRLSFQGSGVTGSAELAAQGDVQRADLKATALNAVIPGDAGLTIGRALVTASIVLADTPQILADAQIANLRSGRFVLKTARAKIDYRGGNGTAQAVATGSTGVPFQIAANAKLSPEQWLVALKGQGSGINFHTVNPARIAIRDGSYHLLPTQLDFDQGSARIAGSYGDGMALQVRLDKLDLAVVNGFVPDIGIGGSASGSLDFAQASASAFPSADARLEIADFTRSSLATVSTPVNISFVGKLLPDGGDARALIKRGGATIGRMVATLRPLGPAAGSWNQRLLAAPLSGGIRYNGPAALPFSLAGLSNQQLTGPIGIAADFAGQVRAPVLTGVVRGENLTYDNENFGTRLTKLKIDGRFSNDAFILDQASATAGDGTVTAQGRVGLSAENGFPMLINASFDNARLARSESLGATATGKITITKNDQVQKIEGRLTIPKANYEIIRQGAAEVPELTGVRRKSEMAANGETQAKPRRAFSNFDLALQVRADNQLFVSGMGLESEWSARVTVGGTTTAPDIRGTMEIVRGTYSFASRRFDISRGIIRFQGSTLTNPSIDISANTTAEGVTAILNIDGTAQQPQIAFTSTPSLPQEEVLSRLFFGTNVTNLSATEAIQLAAALNSLRASGGGLNPLGQLKSATGIDRLRILGADDTTGRGTSLAAGKYITNDIYVEIITDAQGFTATQLEISLTRSLSLLSQMGSFGGSSASLRYSRDY
ncbi:translocation/assembly module TamB domain-containing protein [Sphingomonas sp. dw_22]|uniref:translocation/assembly module TamB domain-containing protein n=1 Tax=Sphingomonas sp. dw_22 TaxID=2721175 RepID=UPI001BD2AC5A|nr:translocation/assembly module TamB domain-containing protein [Sphingomonas sp. dw_22]